ncbi:MAG: type II secretion system protein [Eubacteriaceae bacterium]|nr:type II secretion system protein [Eubacteriaceae bacterium]
MEKPAGPYKKGFTLIELTAGLAIMILLSSMAIFNSRGLSEFKDRQQFKSQTKEIYMLMMEHKNSSIMDGKKRQFYIFRDKIYMQTIKPEGITTEKVMFENDTIVVSNTYSTSPLLFYPLGTVNKGGHITFQSKGGDKITMVIQIGSGRIYLKEGGI